MKYFILAIMIAVATGGSASATNLEPFHMPGCQISKPCPPKKHCDTVTDQYGRKMTICLPH